MFKGLRPRALPYQPTLQWAASLFLESQAYLYVRLNNMARRILQFYLPLFITAMMDVCDDIVEQLQPPTR